MAVLLRALGWGEVLILEGGYKAYRRHVIDSLAAAALPQSFVLRGLTGVGKTLVLRELEELRPGWTLDLEGHARHRSSILGMVGLEPVGQKAFEGDIAGRLRAGFPSDLVVYEGESRKVGDRIVPAQIWGSLTSGTNLKLKTSVERRVEPLCEDYLTSEGSRGALLEQLPFIEQRLGPVKWKGVLTGLLKADRIDELVEALLEHEALAQTILEATVARGAHAHCLGVEVDVRVRSQPVQPTSHPDETFRSAAVVPPGL